ncbi:hypothetical protein [Phaeovulum sp.]|uniref:hypothetical protein n=1 Tax=Phaeovulum sp. TaxID=2934796 RepID=UPI003561557D
MPNQGSDWELAPDAPVPGLARFRELLVPRILAFESLRQAIEKGSGGAAALRDVAEISHKISGVAAPLGYPGIGSNAGTLETTIQHALAAGEPVADIWRKASPMLETLLEGMESILDE